jgi:S-adenosylmethionine:tRNA ribosyltransferase-isomerase
MPPYDFKMVDMLITNFHVPKSSLLCLVDAFLQHKQAKKTILELYEIAIREGFRFFSFGDAMLIK